MTTPKERAHLLDLLNRTVDWPLVAVVDAIAEVIDARDKARAEEFRRLATEAVERSGRLTKEGNRTGALSAMGKAMTWRDAAEMLEEKLNGA